MKPEDIWAYVMRGSQDAQMQHSEVKPGPAFALSMPYIRTTLKIHRQWLASWTPTMFSNGVKRDALSIA
jgi:hypothetical protein